MQAKRVAVFGAGGHGKVVADVALCAGSKVVAFIDDEPSRANTAIWGIPVVSWRRFLETAEWRSVAIALGIGDNAARRRCRDRVRQAGYEVATVVHSAATVSRSAAIRAGTVVMAGAVVNPDAVVGEGCIVNTGAIVEHDCEIGDFAHLSPNAAMGGGVRIGSHSHLGVGAVVLPRVTIGAGVRVGAGAVVIRDVHDFVTMVGVPARPIASREETEASVGAVNAALLQRVAAVGMPLHQSVSGEPVYEGLGHVVAHTLATGSSARAGTEEEK